MPDQTNFETLQLEDDGELGPDGEKAMEDLHNITWEELQKLKDLELKMDALQLIEDDEERLTAAKNLLVSIGAM